MDSESAVGYINISRILYEPRLIPTDGPFDMDMIKSAMSPRFCLLWNQYLAPIIAYHTCHSLPHVAPDIGSERSACTYSSSTSWHRTC